MRSVSLADGRRDCDAKDVDADAWTSKSDSSEELPSLAEDEGALGGGDCPSSFSHNDVPYCSTCPRVSAAQASPFSSSHSQSD